MTAKRTHLHKLIGFITILIIIVFFSICNNHIYASSKYYAPAVQRYENITDSNNESGNGFIISSSYSVQSFSYGKNIGALIVNGDIDHTSTVNGTTAYATNGSVSIGYEYTSGDYQTKVKEDWNLENCDEKNVGDIHLSKKVSKGTMIIQKSVDGKSWESACDPIYDLFDNSKLDYNSLYAIEESDIKSGTYFRVLVVYEMKRKTGVETGKLGIKTDQFQYDFCIEDYVLFVSYANNPVTLYDISNRSQISNNSTVSDGFTFNDCATNTIISVKKDGGNAQTANAYETFNSPGKYSIDITSPMGESFHQSVTVSDGLATHNVTGARYENPEKDKYSLSNPVAGGTNVTSLMIGQRDCNPIETSTDSGIDKYGITGKSVSLFLKIADPETYSSTGWEIVSDDWGKKATETIDDVSVGTVGTGALIVQESSDGKHWNKPDTGKYTECAYKDGLFIKDYCTNWGGQGDVMIYTPSGEAVKKGVYLRVLFAYEIKSTSNKEKKRCIEEYKFCVFSSDLNAVTFHNETVKEQIEDYSNALSYGNADNDADKSLLDQNANSMSGVYQRAETMLSGSVTVSGFTIDTALVPTISCSVKRDGVDIPFSRTYTETGKYDIHLSNAVGNTKDITLYVDRMTPEETISLYFGDGFLEGKRIYDPSSEYPVYEAGSTDYHFEQVPDSYLPLSGTLTNLTTQKSTPISTNRTRRSIPITEAGDYEVVLCNNPSFETDTPSGDNKTITFHFTVREKGHAPGPVVNKQSLDNSMNSSMSGSFPIYYGLSYQSATKGNIILAFSAWENAFQYGYEYEKGIVEDLNDGSYLYSSSFTVEPKEKYFSKWELTEAINHAVEENIHQLYFDMSDSNSYLTLREEDLKDVSHLKDLHLNRSVVVFPNEDEETLLRRLDALPILNDKPYAYLPSGDNKNPKEKADAFEFVQDKYGVDSYSVVITDSNGKEYPIKYRESVDKQLSEAGACTGVVTILEKTKYDDSNTYTAVYFANGENTCKTTIDCYEDDGQIRTEVLTQHDNGMVIGAEAFSINSLEDDLDPYNLIKVTAPDGEITAYTTGQQMDQKWTDVGEYQISVINRIGNKYSFSVIINKTKYATISFTGEGTKEFQQIMTKEGETSVSLPTPVRYGYEFIGYKDNAGKEYKDVIDTISFSGSRVLHSEWKPKEILIYLKDSEGNLLETLNTEFGVVQELPSLTGPDDIVYNGWIYNGSILAQNRLTPNTEDDIILIASNEDVVSDDRTESSDTIEEPHKSKAPVIVCFIAIIGAGAGAFIFLKRKTQNQLVASPVDEADPDKAFDAETEEEKENE